MTASNIAGPVPGRSVDTPEPLPAPRRRKLNAVDREFLPAALEILETPASPVSGAMILAICCLVVVALGWSYFGTLDVLAIAQGKIQPTGRVKTVQAFEISHVAAMHVQNGSHVKAGDVLVELDPRDAEADQVEIEKELASYRAEALRRKAVIKLVRTGAAAPAPTFAWPADIPEGIATNEEQVMHSDLSQLSSQVGSLRAQFAQKQAEQERLDRTIATEIELKQTMQERVDMRTQLLASNSGSRASVIDALETLQQQQITLARDSGQVAEIKANLAAIEEDIQKSLDTFVADNAQKFVEAERKVDSLSQKLVRAQVRTGRMLIRSPISGVVQASILSTVGQVVSPSEELMRIVPDGVQLEVEAYLPNQDIGFVKEGQTAVLKIEAFPFTRYGTVDGRVAKVAHDAVPEPDAQQTEQDAPASAKTASRGAQRVQNLVFPITLALQKQAINVDGVNVQLEPGMAVSAEIKTGRRRILEYLISPLLQTGSEALKER